MDQTYVKALLYAYPKLSEVAEAVACAAENRAALSYRSNMDTLSLAESIAEEFLLSHRLMRLKELLDGAVSSFGEEERLLLEYRYFRRKSHLEGHTVRTDRSYFRRQATLLCRMAFTLMAMGLTRAAFFEMFSSCEFLMKLYAAIEEGAERRIVRPRCQNSARSPSGSGFFPRRTSTATPTTATQAMQMMAISAADSPAEPSGEVTAAVSR